MRDAFILRDFGNKTQMLEICEMKLREILDDFDTFKYQEYENIHNDILDAIVRLYFNESLKTDEKLKALILRVDNFNTQTDRHERHEIREFIQDAIKDIREIGKQ